MNLSNPEWDAILVIIKIVLGVLFLLDLLSLLKKDKQKEIFITFRTTMIQELNRNILSMATFLAAFILFTLFDIHKLDANELDIALDASIILLSLTFFLIPKNIVIGENGVFMEGTLHPWHRIRSAVLKKDIVMLRRDRLYILPPIRIPQPKSHDIYAFALERIEQKKRKKR